MPTPKKKLLVILGAGSSIGIGMPSVATLDDRFKTWSAAWSAQHGGWPDYFEVLWQAVETYQKAGKPALRPALNFEKALGDMVALSQWMVPAPYGNSLRQIACNGAPPPGLCFPCPDRYGPSVTISDQLCHLLVELAKHIRLLSRGIDGTKPSAQRYGTFISALHDEFDVGVYNLNYDTCALVAWPDAFTGFNDTGTFAPIEVYDRRDWGFIYHLHGSVHHSLGDPFGDQICWRQDLAGEFHDGHPGRSDDERSNGKSFPKTTLIAGGFKLDQLLVEPFHSFYAALVRHVYEADAILIGGYGFADEHVNRILRNRLTSAATNQRPPLMVLDRASDKTDPMACRDDLWCHEFHRATGVDGSFFREPGHTSWPNPRELADRAAFEVASGHRVALWHGGFNEAASRLDGILPWLGGEPDEVLTPPVS